MEIKTSRRLAARFRYVNRIMVILWRLGLGRLLNIWPSGSGRILVLVHSGRRSGHRYRTPLNYAEISGVVYLAAGFGAGSDWYRNVLATPDVELWLPGRRVAGRVEDADADPRRTALLREVLLASGFAAPAAGIPVRRLSDPDLVTASTGYRLLRVRIRGPVATAARPGDLAWVWLVIALSVALLAVLLPR